MGKYLKLIIAALIITLVAPLFLKGSDGKPLMTWDSFMPSTEMPTAMTPGAKGAGDTIYKWKDQFGIWQFGENPPQDFKANAIVLSDDAITPLEGGWEGEPIEVSTPSKRRSSPGNVLTQGPQMIAAAKAAAEKGNNHNSELKNIMQEISKNN